MLEFLFFYFSVTILNQIIFTLMFVCYCHVTIQGFRRRRHANHLMMGLDQPILSVPHLTPTSTATPTNLAAPALASEKPEQFEYSLYIDIKESKWNNIMQKLISCHIY